MTLLAVDNLQTEFATRDGVLRAVQGVSFTLARGEVLGLVGESGSGKSVTGFSIMGLVDPPGRVVGGSVRFDGEELVGKSEDQLRRLRGKRIAMIFQDPMMTLNPVLRIDTQMIETVQAHEKVSEAEARSCSRDALGMVANKAFRNGAKNPNAWRREPVDMDTIMNSDMLSYPLTKYMFCSPAEGGVALILASEKAARRFTNRPVFLKAVTMKTRHYGLFEVFSPYQALQQAPAPTVFAAKAAFEMAGLGPEDVGVIQIQDTKSGAEIMHMAENGFCKDGEQEKLLREGATEINGRMPTNTDGGCIANGEPIGASGLRQVYEVVLQLRGEAGERVRGHGGGLRRTRVDSGGFRRRTHAGTLPQCGRKRRGGCSRSPPRRCRTPASN